MNYIDLLRLGAPEAIVTLTALVVLALGLMNERGSALCSFVAILGLAGAAGAVIFLPQNGALPGGMLVMSPLNSLFQVICLGLAAFSVFLAQTNRDFPRPHHGEYLAVLLLATVGLLLLVASEELLMIFIGLELTSLSLYILTAFDKTDARSAEAGLKYLLFGGTASAFTLFGLSLIYGMSGATGLAAIADSLSEPPLQPLLAAGIIMTFVGLGFKIAAAPFHLWAPDVYQGAPISSAAFIASGSKVAAFVVLGKFVLLGFGSVQGSAAWHAVVAGWSPVMAALAALSILIGNFVALAQSNVRRLLAYSAVAHAGYTLLGLVAGNSDGFSATLFYTTTYAVTLIGAFGVVGWVRRETGGDDLSDFSGLFSRSPLLAGCMAIFLLSLAGLPPLAGFFGKFYLFSAALRATEGYGLLWLVVVALFGSFVSLYYYLSVLKAVFTGPAVAINTSTAKEDGGQRFMIALLAALVLFLGVAPNGLAARIAASLQ